MARTPNDRPAPQRRRRLVALAIATSACMALGIGSALVGQSAAQDPVPGDEASQNLMPCTTADEVANFPVYSLGPSVADLQVASITRRCDDLQPGAPARANFVSYTYGVCPQVVDGTANMCAPPLEIQSWPACERSLADYELEPGVPYPHEKLGNLDGVPAYSFDDGTRLELYTGQATIVIFTTDPTLIDQALASIQLEPASEPPGEPTAAGDGQGTSSTADSGTATSTDPQGPDLPDPAPGAISGNLSCA